MPFILYRISTWLIIELVATSILVALNMVIPIVMAFASYRNIINFYFSSAALSSSLLNCLYIYYLVQTFRSKVLSDNNCRAIYYLQTSCTVVLAYTITAMHANFVLCLLSSSTTSSTSSDRDNSTRTCLQSCGLCLRRFFRRFCFCLVLCVWSLSFTATIPLLYTIDSNEKSPKPVYCPGTKQISYLEELFDRNRIVQSILFNIIPLLVTLFISLIALLKLLYDYLYYLYLRFKSSKCSSCRIKSSQNKQKRISMTNSISMFSSIGIVGNNNNNNQAADLNLTTLADSSTPISETTLSSSNYTLQSYGYWCSTSFLRFLLVLSCCLLACIYPIAMRFYLVYFSVLVPLIFAVLNYSLGQLTSTQPQPQSHIQIQTTATTTTVVARKSIAQQTNVENHRLSETNYINTNDVNNGKLLQQSSSIKHEQSCINEEYELQSPLINNLVQENDIGNEREQCLRSPSGSSQSSSIPTTHLYAHVQCRQPSSTGKRKYFSNNLYENYNRNMLTR